MRGSIVLVMGSVLSLWLYHLRSIFRKERSDFCLHFRLGSLIGLGSRRSPSRHRNPDREKKLLLPGWGADAKQPRWLLSSVGEGMRRVGRDVEGRSCSHDQFFAAKRRFNFTFEDGKRFLKVVTMIRWATARRNVHVNEAITTVSVVASEQDGVGVPDDTDMSKARVVIRIRNQYIAEEIVRGDRRQGPGCDGMFIHDWGFPDWLNNQRNGVGS